LLLSSLIHFFQGFDRLFILSVNRRPKTTVRPQGSLLFLLFVDDLLPDTVKTSRVACYADDIKIFKSIDSITGCNGLQLTLTILSVRPNHLGSYFISPSINTSESPAKEHVYSTPIPSAKCLWNLLTRERPWCVGVKQSYLGQTSD